MLANFTGLAQHFGPCIQILYITLPPFNNHNTQETLQWYNPYTVQLQTLDQSWYNGPYVLFIIMNVVTKCIKSNTNSICVDPMIWKLFHRLNQYALPTFCPIPPLPESGWLCFFWGPSLSRVSLDLFQPKTSSFSTRALIWVHFKTVRYFYQPIFSLFSYFKNAL